MIVLVSLIVLPRFFVPTVFHMVHPHISIHSFSRMISHLFHMKLQVYAVAHMRKPTALHLTITC